MRWVTLTGAVAVHAVLGALLVSLEHPVVSGGQPSRLELIELVPPPPSLPPTPTPTPASSAGGRASPPSRPPTRAHHTAPRHAMPDPSDELSTTIEATGDSGGEGHGLGGGRGDGVGAGQGRLADLLPPPPPPPPPAPGPPPVSKARPARLIYPSRQVQIDDDLLFAATLIVDSEGFVAGARLTRGFGGPRDAQAASLVWRFRYAPALDDAGQPIRSTVDQHFMVEH